MAGIKISGLPAVPNALLTDIVPIVQAGVTYKETLSQIATLFNAQLTFLPLAGGTMSGNIAMGGNSITGLADPVNAQDAATKNYVDSIATGQAVPVVAATTANLTVTYANGASGVGATLTNAGTQAVFSIDGQSPTIGQRVLIKNQSSTFQNGIYTVTNVGSIATNWILTRALDYDTPTNINDTGLIPVTAGTANANTSWYNTTTMVAVGTTAVTFIQFGSNGTVTSVATAGLATGGPITTSGTVTVMAAVKADQTTATSTSVAVVPGVQQFHPSATKFWVSFVGSTGVVNASYNVSGVVRNSTGNYTITYTNPFSSVNYCLNFSCSTSNGAIGGNSEIITSFGQTASTCSVNVTGRGSGVAEDAATVFVSGFGAQ